MQIFSSEIINGFSHMIFAIKFGSLAVNNYLDLRCLLSTYCTDGLIGLSVRWIQPYQQQGRRIPSLSSVRVLSTCSFLVSGFLTEITQQIHSLRASAVRSSHAASASGSEVKTSRKSAGILCTTPLDITFLVIGLFYQSFYWYPQYFSNFRYFLQQLMR